MLRKGCPAAAMICLGLFAVKNRAASFTSSEGITSFPKSTGSQIYPQFFAVDNITDKVPTTFEAVLLDTVSANRVTNVCCTSSPKSSTFTLARRGKIWHLKCDSAARAPDGLRWIKTSVLHFSANSANV